MIRYEIVMQKDYDMKKRIYALIMTAALLAGNLTGCTIGDTQFELDMNDVGRNDVFSINGMDCSKQEARLYLCNYQNIYGYEYGFNLWQHDFGDADSETSLENYVKEIVLVELANVFCMNQLAEENEIVLTEEELELVSQATEEYYASLSKEELRYMDLDKGNLKEYYEKYALARKYCSTLTQGVNEEVSDDEARVILVQQILVKSKETADFIKQNLIAGADFASLAAQYNEADSGELYLARGMYPDVIDESVFALDNNYISDVIETEEGYYIFKCLDKYVKDLTEENKQKILVQRREQQFHDAFQGFIQSSDFDLNEKVWADIVVDTSGEIQTDSFFEIYEKYFQTEKLQVME